MFRFIGVEKSETSKRATSNKKVRRSRKTIKVTDRVGNPYTGTHTHTNIQSRKKTPKEREHEKRENNVGGKKVHAYTLRSER